MGRGSASKKRRLNVIAKLNILTPLCISDFMSDSSRLTFSERGAYLLLIIDYCENGALPDDDLILSRIIGARIDEWEPIKMVVKSFFKSEGGKLTHEKIDGEINRVKEKANKYVERAKKGAAARWSINDNATSNATSMLQASSKQCLSNATSIINQSNHMLTENYLSTAVVTNDEDPNDLLARKKNDDVKKIFEHWKCVMNRPKSKIDVKRRRLINTRLEEGYTVEQLIEAVTGCAKSDYHMGTNERRVKYNSLDLIFRNADKVDAFIAMHEEQRSTLTPLGQSNAKIAYEFLQERRARRGL